MRLDRYLVEQKIFESRNRAIEAIKNGIVTVDGKRAKPSSKIDTNSNIEIKDSKFYVSRAAMKLEGFLEEHYVDIKGKRVLDIGSSTGGFAQIVLENDPKSIDCVDVGRDQLHHSLHSNPVLNLHEQTDIREFETDKCFEIITCDVSFISILQIIDDIQRLSCDYSDIIILYKPQFEVGKETKRDSKGVVSDQNAIQKAMKEFEEQTKIKKWLLIHKSVSKLSGKEGNIEYLYHFKKEKK